jgi:hypothetical protein
MKRKAIIHVGLEKTGSTAIQAWLYRERQALLDLGFYVPRSLGIPNHTLLVAACLDDGVVDDLKAHYLAHQGRPEANWRDSVRAEFEAELAEATDWTQLVISSELISSRLHSPTELARLTDWIGRHVDRLHFVVYLRRQDQLAVSRYSSALREGHAGFDDIWSDLSGNSFLKLPTGRVVTDELEYFNHERILARFLALGDVDITVRAYDPPEGPLDVVADFRALLGLAPGSASITASRSNPALSAAAQYVISQLNHDYRVRWPSGARNTPYRALLQRIEAELQGPPRQVPRAEAEAFLARFEASNAAVAQRWFPGGLFGSDMSQWPEAVDYSGMIAELAPAVAHYRAEAAKLPQKEEREATIRRLWPGLERVKRSLGRKSKQFNRNLIGLITRLQHRDVLAALSAEFPPSDPKIVIARVIGNDLWPRHSTDQSIRNLEFILTHEPTPRGVRKLFVLNRIVDKEVQVRAETMVREAGHDVLIRPFEPEVYKALRLDTSFLGGDDCFLLPAFAAQSYHAQVSKRLWAAAPKIRYAMDVNGGRNAALDWGRARADWTLVLDGNCFFTAESLQGLLADLTSPPFTAYLRLPMQRVARNDDALTFRGAPDETEEPQLVFSVKARGSFDLAFPYGMRDKTSLLERIGIPGAWDDWGEFPWLPTGVPLPDRHSWKTTRRPVFRLSSAVRDGVLELPQSHKARNQARNRAIFQTLGVLDARFGADDRARTRAILGLGEGDVVVLRGQADSAPSS